MPPQPPDLNPDPRTAHQPGFTLSRHEMTGVAHFQLLTRAGCELCEEMLAELEQFCLDRDASIEVLDVDNDPQLRTRYGHQVPVLLLDGEPVCHARFDAAEVTRLLRPRR